MSTRQQPSRRRPHRLLLLAALTIGLTLTTGSPAHADTPTGLPAATTTLNAPEPAPSGPPTPDGASSGAPTRQGPKQATGGDHTRHQDGTLRAPDHATSTTRPAGQPRWAHPHTGHRSAHHDGLTQPPSPPPG